MADLQPQAALETAVVDLLCSGLTMNDVIVNERNCGRVVLDGQPPPRMGLNYTAVWGKSGKKPHAALALDQVFSLFVTVTVRLVQPYDRAVVHRDWLEERCDKITNILALDRYNFVIINAANTYAGFRSSGSPDGISDAGFCEPLVWQGTDDIVEVGPDWFHAHIDDGDRNCGYAQTIRFGGARLTKDFQYV